MNAPKEKEPRKKMGLTSKIFIGLIAGLVVGIIFNLLIPSNYVRDTVFVEGIFYVIGQGFIRLMKML
ncbi:MAG: dicarboxylate/amino acid:cation symporter, partial [Clostridia bacterium]|nr:dicarboxylate/amino acid:cation symporter [Clostridia bacterium]